MNQLYVCSLTMKIYTYISAISGLTSGLFGGWKGCYFCAHLSSQECHFNKGLPAEKDTFIFHLLDLLINGLGH